MSPRLQGFSWSRWWSMVLKEFLQLRRDRITFGMIVGMPIMQLALFGYAINTDPKQMPTAVIAADHSPFTRSFVAAMKASDYFRITEELKDEEAGRAALAQGRVLFVLTIPPDFSRRLLRGERPALLIEADATDPMATGLAIGAATQLTQAVAEKDLTGALAPLAGAILAGLFGTGFLGRPIGRRGSHIITILGVLISTVGSLSTTSLPWASVVSTPQWPWSVNSSRQVSAMIRISLPNSCLSSAIAAFKTPVSLHAWEP